MLTQVKYKSNVMSLDHEYINSNTKELILQSFERLADEIAESLLMQELLLHKTASILDIEIIELGNLDTLACRIDNIFDNYRSKIIAEVKETIEKFNLYG